MAYEDWKTGYGTPSMCLNSDIKEKGGGNILYPPHVDLCFEALVVKREKLRKFCCSRETSIHKTSGFTGRLRLKNELESKNFELSCLLECCHSGFFLPKASACRLLDTSLR